MKELLEKLNFKETNSLIDGIIQYEKNIGPSTIRIWFSQCQTLKSLCIVRDKIIHRIPFPRYLKSWINEYERLNEFLS